MQCGALAEGHGKHTESAGFSGTPDVAQGQQVPALVVPQYLGGEHAEPEPAHLLLCGNVLDRGGAERPLEGRRRSRVALRDQQHQAIYHQIGRTWWLWCPARGLGGLGRLTQTATCSETAGVQRRGERLQVGLARQPGIEWFETSGGLQQQRRGVASAAGGERDLPAQQVGPGALELVERLCLGRGQQPQRSVERARLGRCPCGGQLALRPESRLGRESGGPFEEGGCRGQAAAGLRPAGGSLELGGDVLIRPGCCLGPVPGPAVGIGAGIGGLGEGTVDAAAAGGRCRLIDGRTDQRVAEGDPGRYREQPVGLGR